MLFGLMAAKRASGFGRRDLLNSTCTKFGRSKSFDMTELDGEQFDTNIAKAHTPLAPTVLNRPEALGYDEGYATPRATDGNPLQAGAIR